MSFLYVSFQIRLECSFIIALVASIIDTFMFRLNMRCQSTLESRFIIALITCILDKFVFRLNMSFQMAL